jgi:CO/xanthine dehydrogenase FAD-binding subunit
MKAPAFLYERPLSRAEAFAILAAHGDEARVLAGGQRSNDPKLAVELRTG